MAKRSKKKKRKSKSRKKKSFKRKKKKILRKKKKKISSKKKSSKQIEDSDGNIVFKVRKRLDPLPINQLNGFSETSPSITDI